MLAACSVDGEQESHDGSSGGSSSSSGSSSSGELPSECSLEPQVDAECESVTPVGVACQGAPTELILDLSCDYLYAASGLGNVYCCPTGTHEGN